MPKIAIPNIFISEPPACQVVSCFRRLKIMLSEGMLTALPAYFPTCEGAYLVGGCVRDLLLGRPPADYDVVVLGDPQAYAQTLAAAAGGRIVAIGKPAFRLWRVVAAGAIIDVTAAAGASIAKDLRHRDFTINALALDMS
ncbi:MAG: hypothetical protein E4H48_03355, partial [Syntrophobacterales bacterium]